MGCTSSLVCRRAVLTQPTGAQRSMHTKTHMWRRLPLVVLLGAMAATVLATPPEAEVRGRQLLQTLPYGDVAEMAGASGLADVQAGTDTPVDLPADTRVDAPPPASPTTTGGTPPPSSSHTHSPPPSTTAVSGDPPPPRHPPSPIAPNLPGSPIAPPPALPSLPPPKLPPSPKQPPPFPSPPPGRPPSQPPKGTMKCATHDDCGLYEYCDSIGRCYHCDGADGCCAMGDTITNLTCPLKCTCNCDPSNWCKKSCHLMDECANSVWASYSCPKERDDTDDVYCKTAGLGLLSIVVLSVTVIMIMIMCLLCCQHQRHKGSATKMFYTDEESGGYGSTGGKYTSVPNNDLQTGEQKRAARLAALGLGDENEDDNVYGPMDSGSMHEDTQRSRQSRTSHGAAEGRAEARRQARMAGASAKGGEQPTPKQSAEAHREARRQARLALTAGNAQQRAADGSRSAAESRWQARVASLTAGDGGSLADDLARTRGKKSGNSGLAVPPPMTSSSRRNRSVSYSSDNSL